MNQKKHWIVVSVLVLVFFLVGWTTSGQKRNSLKTTWEYKSLANASDAALNELGAQGWELITVVNFRGGTAYYLKRAK